MYENVRKMVKIDTDKANIKGVYWGRYSLAFLCASTGRGRGNKATTYV